MRCPFCGVADTRVIDSRVVGEGDSVRRRRECVACQGRFTTYEQFEASYPAVVKRDGGRVPFDENKLRSGIERALEKRPVSAEQVDALISRVQRQLYAYGERECPAAQLGEWVMDGLRHLDQVAYVRFASVYRSFEHVNAFREEVERLQSPLNPEPEAKG